jgi:hypothetical protein
MISIHVLKASGLTDEQIVRVLQTDERERILRRREQNRINKQNQRSRQHVSADLMTSKFRQRNHRARNDVTRDMRDMRDPPIPPSSTSTPTPITPLTPHSEFLRNSAWPPTGGETAGPTHADLERELFRRGKQICGETSGGLIANLLKSRQHDVALARSVVELAATKHDPREFIAAAAKNGGKNGHQFGNGSEIKGSAAGDRCRELAELAREREREAGVGRPPDPLRGD